MSETIVVKFDPTTLPKWAQKDPNVLRLCEKSLSFRIDVIEAKTRAMQEHLRKAARNIYDPNR
jgi:hypothetical protein